jgi:hypothetical protein
MGPGMGGGVLKCGGGNGPGATTKGAGVLAVMGPGMGGGVLRCGGGNATTVLGGMRLGTSGGVLNSGRAGRGGGR